VNKRPSAISTLKTVADQAGVSVPTASFVLNGHGDRQRIATGTQERVRNVARELSYQANPFASNLRRKRSFTIGVLWSFSGPHQSNFLIQHFSESARKLGYSAIINDTLSTLPLIKAQLSNMARWRVDGLVFALNESLASAGDGELHKLLHNQKNLLLVVDEVLSPLPFPQIVQSRAPALKTATNHVLASGRKRLAFVGKASSQKGKIGAIRHAIHAYGSDADFTILNIDSPEDISREALQSVIERLQREPADAIFTSTDEIAAALIKMLREQDKRVPEDVAVIGFNDNPIATLFDPPIASVRRFDERLATYAIEHVIGMADGTLPEDGTPRRFDMEFIWRESAGGAAVVRSPNGNQAAFTLLEILVGLGMIAVLSALLFPLLGNLRQRASGAGCLNNLRSIGVAIQQYVSDHDNNLPINVTSSYWNGKDVTRQSWYQAVDEYLGCDYDEIYGKPPSVKRTAFFCPAEREVVPPYATYAINRELDKREWNETPHYPVTAIVSPQKYVLVSDSFRSEIIYSDRIAKMTDWNHITRRHQEHPNFLYADGHAESFTQPIIGLSDPNGQTPFYRSLWEARYQQ